MLTIRNKPLHAALYQAAKFISRGAVVHSCTAPKDAGGSWEVVLTWPDEPRYRTVDVKLSRLDPGDLAGLPVMEVRHD